MPHARPCDGYFHLRQKQSGISTRCKAVKLQNGHMVKTDHAWIMAVLDSVRQAPSLDIFSAVWSGFLGKLSSLGESVVAAYLSATYL